MRPVLLSLLNIIFLGNLFCVSKCDPKYNVSNCHGHVPRPATSYNISNVCLECDPSAAAQKKLRLRRGPSCHGFLVSDGL